MDIYSHLSLGDLVNDNTQSGCDETDADEDKERGKLNAGSIERFIIPISNGGESDPANKHHQYATLRINDIKTTRRQREKKDKRQSHTSYPATKRKETTQDDTDHKQIAATTA
jgi:hypothetical protein